MQEEQDEDETAEVHQVQQLIEAPQQSQSTPVTPPVVQGHVPAELLPPTQIPSFVMTPLPQVQQSTEIAPPPPPPGPPPSEESPQQVSQPVMQQPHSQILQYHLNNLCHQPIDVLMLKG